MAASERTVVKTTCPRDCYDACGMSVVKEDGRIRIVTGDADHFVSQGSLCGKCALAYNGAWTDPKQRLLHPLRRTGAKGRGEFERVSWDDALGEIAGRLNAILGAGASSTILHTHYTGTCSAIAGNFPSRFFRSIGATEVDPDTVCNKAGHIALNYVFGDSLAGFDPRTAKDSRCILIWGANPSSSAPHVHKHWLADAPGRLIVIDPIRHETARAADLYLQLRPGSDAALAFGMLRVIADEGLIDRSFLAAHAIGWDEIEPLLADIPPARAEALTGVPQALIREAALTYAQGPSLMWLGQGMQRQPMGGNAFRAAATLCAATGNICKPGAGILYMNGPRTRGIDFDRVGGAWLAKPEAGTVSHMDLATILADPARSRALFCWNNNIVASNPAQRRLREALRRDDLLHVVIDLFPTDTADYADFVLPASSFLEFDDLVLPYFHNALSAQAAAVERFGESLPNQEIFRRLAAAMKLAEPALYESDESLIAGMLRDAGYDGDFRSLAAQGTVQLSDEPPVQFAGGKFPTPSGKIELASERAAADGHPRAPFVHADPPANDSKLRLLSPASLWTLNSSYANDRKIRGRLAESEVLVNAADAAARALSDGSKAELVNDTGRLPVAVRISADVPPGVAVVFKGRWPKHDPAQANVNLLNPGTKTDMGESSAVHSVEALLVPRAEITDQVEKQVDRIAL
ncbi:MAG: molybdopterin-dependent oxidoreductase [Alphaproteobacteria bacterium]